MSSRFCGRAIIGVDRETASLKAEQGLQINAEVDMLVADEREVVVELLEELIGGFVVEYVGIEAVSVDIAFWTACSASTTWAILLARSAAAVAAAAVTAAAAAAAADEATVKA